MYNYMYQSKSQRRYHVFLFCIPACAIPSPFPTNCVSHKALNFSVRRCIRKQQVFPRLTPKFSSSHPPHLSRRNRRDQGPNPGCIASNSPTPTQEVEYPIKEIDFHHPISLPSSRVRESPSKCRKGAFIVDFQSLSISEIQKYKNEGIFISQAPSPSKSPL